MWDGEGPGAAWSQECKQIHTSQHRLEVGQRTNRCNAVNTYDTLARLAPLASGRLACGIGTPSPQASRSTAHWQCHTAAAPLLFSQTAPQTGKPPPRGTTAPPPHVLFSLPGSHSSPSNKRAACSRVHVRSCHTAVHARRQTGWCKQGKHTVQPHSPRAQRFAQTSGSSGPVSGPCVSRRQLQPMALQVTVGVSVEGGRGGESEPPLTLTLAA